MSAQSAPRWRSDAALRPQPKRDGPDDWPTPPCLCDALLRHVVPGLPPGPIWEPAAGAGALAATMMAAGRAVLATDLPDMNFLTDPPPAPCGGLAAVVTNPPFNSLDAFTARGLHHLDAGTARALVLLWRWDHLTAASRGAALRRASAIHLCQWRPRWIADSTTGPRWSFAWITWRADHPGPPALIPINRRE
jgi:hypothetical protein